MKRLIIDAHVQMNFLCISSMYLIRENKRTELIYRVTDCWRNNSHFRYQMSRDKKAKLPRRVRDLWPLKETVTEHFTNKYARRSTCGRKGQMPSGTTSHLVALKRLLTEEKPWKQVNPMWHMKYMVVHVCVTWTYRLSSDTHVQYACRVNATCTVWVARNTNIRVI